MKFLLERETALVFHGVRQDKHAPETSILATNSRFTYGHCNVHYNVMGFVAGLRWIYI
jgi:hypothetical protein